MDLLTYVIFALASYRATRLVTTDVIFEPIREWIWKRKPSHKGIGYLITCNWCTGIWVSTILVLGYVFVPEIAYVVSLVLSISAIVGLVSTRLDS